MGMTGCGKSTFCQHLLLNRRNVVIVDPKHQFTTLQDHDIAYTVEQLDSLGNGEDSAVRPIIFRPSMEYLDSGQINEVYAWVFERGNTLLYNDELTTIIPNAMKFPSKLRAIHTQGRSKGITVVETTQRPSGIPGWIYSESDVFVKFTLGTAADQKRMSEYMGETVIEPSNYPVESCHDSKHSFYFYRVGTRANAEEYILDLENGENNDGSKSGHA